MNRKLMLKRSFSKMQVEELSNATKHLRKLKFLVMIVYSTKRRASLAILRRRLTNV